MLCRRRYVFRVCFVFQAIKLFKVDFCHSVLFVSDSHYEVKHFFCQQRSDYKLNMNLSNGLGVTPAEDSLVCGYTVRGHDGRDYVSNHLTIK
jgi:hypothetical protein